MSNEVCCYRKMNNNIWLTRGKGLGEKIKKIKTFEDNACTQNWNCMMFRYSEEMET